MRAAFPSFVVVAPRASNVAGLLIMLIRPLTPGPSGLGMYAQVANPTAQAGICAQSSTGFGYGVYGRAAGTWTSSTPRFDA
jgi:hypothetical protein